MKYSLPTEIGEYPLLHRQTEAVQILGQAGQILQSEPGLGCVVEGALHSGPASRRRHMHSGTQGQFNTHRQTSFQLQSHQQ